jgi:plastocyanin
VRTATAVTAAVLLGAVPAHADQQLSAVPVDSYASGSVTIDQGEALTFANLDLLDHHDVTAVRDGEDGRALFASATIGPGQTAPVAGVQYLTSGDYGFYCSVHQFMSGMLRVTGSGAPLPRPGDAKPPAVELFVASRKLRRVARRGKLLVTVQVDERSSVSVTARARRATLGKAQLEFAGPGARTVALAIGKKGRALLSKRRRLRISVAADARDASGNLAQTRAARTLAG